MARYAGEVARDIVTKAGGLYFDDVLDRVTQVISSSSPSARRVFAAWCADALLRHHELADDAQMRPFTLSWRPVLSLMIQELEGSPARAAEAVQLALADFHNGPLDNDEGQDGPDDANHDPAAAAIYAAECFLDGEADPAVQAASRVIDYAFSLVDIDEGAIRSRSPGQDLAYDCMTPVVQETLRNLLKGLEVLTPLEVGDRALADLFSIAILPKQT